MDFETDTQLKLIEAKTLANKALERVEKLEYSFSQMERECVDVSHYHSKELQRQRDQLNELDKEFSEYVNPSKHDASPQTISLLDKLLNIFKK